MGAFWESNFIEKETMWGFKPAESAIMANDIFREIDEPVKFMPGHPPMKFTLIVCKAPELTLLLYSNIKYGAGRKSQIKIIK